MEELKQDKVFFSMGLTINLGNYNSMKVDAGISSALLPGESKEDAQERVQENVVSYLSSHVDKLQSEAREIMRKKNSR